MTHVQVAHTADLDASTLAEARALLDAVFQGELSEDDWEHALGGVHALAYEDGELVGHASVVQRRLLHGGQALRTGYVEAVATDPSRQRRGIGSALMREVNQHLAEDGFELGALGTGSQGFYERLGWSVWRGPSSVRTSDGERPTPEEDGYILVLRTASTPALDMNAPISCAWRPGDVW